MARGVLDNGPCFALIFMAEEGVAGCGRGAVRKFGEGLY